MTRRIAKPRVYRGEELLSSVDHVVLDLEDGRRVKLSIEEELAVPDDPVDLYEEALKGHSRLAFWDYQASRALARVRAAEAALDALLGDLRYRYGRAAKDEDRYTASTTVDGLVKSDSRVQEATEGLNALRERWNILRAVVGALDHRTHLLRRLLANDQDAQRGQ